jgi:hypothetical protein
MAISIQSILAIAALLGAIYAAYDLVFGVHDWGQALPGVIARGWICALLATVGVDQVVFGQNALLQLGYLLGLPLLAVQIGVVLSLLVAGYLWSSG